MQAASGMMGTVDEDNARKAMRAADIDREAVAERLRSAHAEGRIDLAEYDERVRQAWAAHTYGELAMLTADLPRPDPPRPAGATPAVHGHGRRHCPGRWRGSVAAWLSISLINLMIWAIVSVATLSLIYPWWVWVAGPWGAVLLAGWITERVHGARPPH